MAIYEIETEDGAVYEIETEDGPATPTEPAAAPQTAPVAPEASGGFGKALASLKQSAAYQTSPMSMLEQVPGLLSKGTAALGGYLAEGLAKPEMRKNTFNNQMYNANPLGASAAAAIGTGVSMLPEVGMATAIPASGAKAAAEAAPGLLERIGARGVNNAAGISPKTLMRVAGNENPATAGTKLGRSLVEEGAFGATPGSTFEKARGVMEDFGQQVQSALSQIKASGQATTVKADDALQPLIEKWVSLKDSALQGNRALAKPFEEIYGKLATSAEKNGGQLALDDLRAAMKETGEALSRAAKDSPKEAAYSELYATLAQARDAMVKRIAENAGNPQLAENLLSANAGYSKYSRIMPDIERAAAKEGVSKFPLFKPIQGAVEAIQPMLSKAAVKLGRKSPRSVGAPAVGVTAQQALERRHPIPLTLLRGGKSQPKPLFKKAS